jgi:beta-galactosidase/beta-glucuronidase
MKGQALKFEINGKTVFYKGVIRIDPKPWFFPAMDEAYQRGYVDQAAMKQIEKELKERNLGY